ncbi:hypothetical protein BJX66DRAFT_43305 [Aspergillus keveii]|uniref:Secreted protein n=1 Tax=Aspergillus keveii TaxID=714993 RepID=A0ABR4FRQ5_9EURO
MHSLPSWPLATWLLRAGIGILQSLPVAKLGPENSACTSCLLIFATISVGPWHEFWCHTCLHKMGIISLVGRKRRRLEATIKMLKLATNTHRHQPCRRLRRSSAWARRIWTLELSLQCLWNLI